MRENLRAVWSQVTRWGDIAVQRLLGDTDLTAKIADFGLFLAHGSHSKTDLCGCHLEWATTGPTSRLSSGEASEVRSKVKAR